MIAEVFVGYCRVCGLEYACFDDWLQHRYEHDEPEVEDWHRGLLPRPPRGQHQGDAA